MELRQTSKPSNEAFEEQKKSADLYFKQDMRREALRTALNMQPTVYQNPFGNNGKEKSVASLLADTEKIYNWLIKDL